jgi:two-component system cell cycle response regulator
MVEEKKRILVVDESEQVRSEIREELADGRFEVIEAKDGVEALMHVASDAPPDLVTMDVEIPRMTGFASFSRLREKHRAGSSAAGGEPPLPVVFITENDTMEDRKRGFEMGGAEFITKPFQKGEVLAAVNKILYPAGVGRDICALIADDSSVSRTVASACLKREGIQVIEADDGAEAYEFLRENLDTIDIVITDMMMPVMDGKALCRKIRRELAVTDMPIIFLTAVSDLSELLEVFKAGASDYLVKPFAKEELLARIMVHIERNRINKQLRETIEVLKEANEEIQRLSIMDPLTGCYNRGYLNLEVPREILRAARYQRALSILLCDIDHFKAINDTYGHLIGDHVLVEVIDRMTKVTRRDIDWIARYGGEEFIVVLPETPPDAACIVGEKLRRTVASQPIVFQEDRISVTASFGVAGFHVVSGPSVSMDDLLREADKGLYQAKQNGRNRVIRPSS